MILHWVRRIYVYISAFGLSLYCLQRLMSAGYQNSRPIPLNHVVDVSLIQMAIATGMWLLSLWALKRNHLWTLAICAWFSFLSLTKSYKGWRELEGFGVSALELAVGNGALLYLFLLCALGLAMPILNYFGLLAPEPPLPPKEGAQA